MGQAAARRREVDRCYAKHPRHAPFPHEAHLRPQKAPAHVNARPMLGKACSGAWREWWLQRGRAPPPLPPPHLGGNGHSGALACVRCRVRASGTLCTSAPRNASSGPTARMPSFVTRLRDSQVEHAQACLMDFLYLVPTVARYMSVSSLTGMPAPPTALELKKRAEAEKHQEKRKEEASGVRARGAAPLPGSVGPTHCSAQGDGGRGRWPLLTALHVSSLHRLVSVPATARRVSSCRRCRSIAACASSPTSSRRVGACASVSWRSCSSQATTAFNGTAEGRPQQSMSPGGIC